MFDNLHNISRSASPKTVSTVTPSAYSNKLVYDVRMKMIDCLENNGLYTPNSASSPSR